MANHSPETDNYVEKKTWDEAVNGKKASGKAKEPAKKPEPQKNEARNNGGGDGPKAA